jgi:hypothetical protein
VQPTGGWNTTGDFTPGVLGTSGPVQLTLPNSPVSYYPKSIAVTQDPNFPDIKFNQDVNDGTPLGLGEIYAITDARAQN